MNEFCQPRSSEHRERGRSPCDCDWFLKLLQTPAPAEGGGGQRWPLMVVTQAK